MIRKSTISIITCNEINNVHANLFFQQSSEIFQGLIKKTSRAFPGVSRDFQGFKNFSGISRISRVRTNPEYGKEDYKESRQNISELIPNMPSHHLTALQHNEGQITLKALEKPFQF